MKITILNGDMKQGESDFSNYLEKLSEKLQENHTIHLYRINEMDLHYCVRCWNCWWKTPGRCTIQDDADKILASVINSDFIIFASPIMAGFTSSSLKKIHDRFVGLVHPYILIKNEECHHKKRHENYPNFGLLLEKEADTDDEDLKIIDEIYDRFALNFHCKKNTQKSLPTLKLRILSMKLAIINGSPRFKKSNSTLLINQFLSGYHKIIPDEVPIHYLANQQMRDEAADAFLDSDEIILIFPLYTDCMPGIVKEFIESITQMNKNDIGGKKIGFIVQSGFPEAIHSVAVEHYLEKLAKRLQCEYLGTVIKGGVEGIQIMPPFMTWKLFLQFEKLGEYFAKYSAFSTEIMDKLRKPYKMSPTRRTLFLMMAKTGLTNFYWNSNLKKNGAFEKRFDKPYEL